MSNNSYTVQGVLYKKHPQEIKSEKFTVQNIVIKTIEEYPQFLLIQASNKAISKIEAAKEGDTIKVDVNVQGRLWTGPDGVEKCFNTLSLWNCEIVNSVSNNMTQPAASGVQTANQNEIVNDLPF